VAIGGSRSINPGSVTYSVVAMCYVDTASDIGTPYGIRDMAVWDYALSDGDFDTLNSQLCTEYGIT
jgi:hypothetical protein